MFRSEYRTKASERSTSLIDAVSSQTKFLASLWILVVRILYVQLFKNIPLHYTAKNAFLDLSYFNTNFLVGVRFTHCKCYFYSIVLSKSVIAKP